MRNEGTHESGQAIKYSIRKLRLQTSTGLHEPDSLALCTLEAQEVPMETNAW